MTKLFKFLGKLFIKHALLMLKCHFQVHVVEQDFKSLYLGSHDKALQGAVGPSSSSSGSSLAISNQRDPVGVKKKATAEDSELTRDLGHAMMSSSCSLQIPNFLLLFLLWRI